MTGWLTVSRGSAPLILSLPHTGTDIPAGIEVRLASIWRARKDTDWWVEKLYDFATVLDITVIRTGISRTVIDVNRDPTGAPLYPGMDTTELCPLTCFDGEKLYRPRCEPDKIEISRRRTQYFVPYHETLQEEIARLRGRHAHVLVFDAHSIRSVIPRLFEGQLPNFNIGTDEGRTADPVLQRAVEKACAHPDFTSVSNGRFRGGWITRRYGAPATGVHALQMELACRSYMDEPAAINGGNWPPPYDPYGAGKLRVVLIDILRACLVALKDLEP